MSESLNNKTILFVHGAWHGKWCWDIFFRPFFEKKGFNVVTFDLPKHNKPGKVKGINSLSINDYVNALKIEVEKLNHKPIIIAHSMGGLVLQKYLETETCKKAILLAPVPVSGVLRTTLNFAKQSYFYPSLVGLNLFGLVNSNEKSRKAFFSKELSKEKLEQYTSLLCSESFLAFLNMLFPKVKKNKNSLTKMLVVAAENDAIFTIDENKRTAKFHNADFILLKNIAHDMMLDENKEKAAEAILSWIR